MTPNGRIVVLEEAGHLPDLEAPSRSPEEILTLVRE